MSIYDDLVTPEIVNKDFLYSLFDAAYMECSRDSDGDTVVEEHGLRCSVALGPDHKWIHLAIGLALDEQVALAKKLECANTINDDFVVIRAAITFDGYGILFDYYIPLDGGVSRKSIVLSTRRFIEIVRQASLERVSECRRADR